MIFSSRLIEDAVNEFAKLPGIGKKTALRMVLEADHDPEDLSSLRTVVSGTAPLDPADADAFTARYGVPVLISYGATEFGGGVAGWAIASSGERPHAGAAARARTTKERMRISDPEIWQSTCRALLPQGQACG